MKNFSTYLLLFLVFGLWPDGQLFAQKTGSGPDSLLRFALSENRALQMKEAAVDLLEKFGRSADKITYNARTGAAAFEHKELIINDLFQAADAYDVEADLQKGRSPVPVYDHIGAYLDQLYDFARRKKLRAVFEEIKAGPICYEGSRFVRLRFVRKWLRAADDGLFDAADRMAIVSFDGPENNFAPKIRHIGYWDDNFADSTLRLPLRRLKVRKPAAGSIFQADSVFFTSWIDTLNRPGGAEFRGPVRLDLFYAGYFVKNLGQNVPNKGRSSGKIDSLQAGTHYQIKVSAENDPEVFDFSPEFSVECADCETAKLLKWEDPCPGPTDLAPGDTLSLAWHSEGMTKIRLEFLSPEGLPVWVIDTVPSRSENDSLIWRVRPPTKSRYETYRLRICDYSQGFRDLRHVLLSDCTYRLVPKKEED